MYILKSDLFQNPNGEINLSINRIFTIAKVENDTLRVRRNFEKHYHRKLNAIGFNLALIEYPFNKVEVTLTTKQGIIKLYSDKETMMKGETAQFKEYEPQIFVSITEFKDETGKPFVPTEFQLPLFREATND